MRVHHVKLQDAELSYIVLSMDMAMLYTKYIIFVGLLDDQHLFLQEEIVARDFLLTILDTVLLVNSRTKVSWVTPKSDLQ